MTLKLEEHRIMVSVAATVDYQIEAMVDRFRTVASTLVHLAKANDFEEYTVAVEELCRVSRMTIWEFIRSGCCSERQVRDAMELFESVSFESADTITPECPPITEFVEAIKNRAMQLRLAIESHDDDLFAEVG